MSIRTPDELKKLKLTELKKICSELDLPTSGNKIELVERIVCHDDKPIVTLQPDDEAELLDNVSDTAETDISASLDASMEPPVREPTPPPPAPAPTSTKPQQQPTRGLKRRAEEVVEEDDGVTVAVKKPTLVSPPPPVEPPASEKSTEPTPVSHATSEEERIALRAQRFGLPAGAARPPANGLKEEKMLQRAKRFGLPVDKAAVSLSDEEKLKARAGRFAEVASLKASTEEEEAKKAKRLEKFGITPVTAGHPLTSKEEQEKKNARAARFGLTAGAAAAATITNSFSSASSSVDPEKLRKRAQRFGLTPGPA